MVPGNTSASASKAGAHIAWASGEAATAAAISSHRQETAKATSATSETGAFGCFLNQATSRKARDLLRNSRAPGTSEPGLMSGQEARMSSSERPVPLLFGDDGHHLAFRNQIPIPLRRGVKGAVKQIA